MANGKILLIILNDTDGSQCGASYKRRCDLASINYGTAEAWLKMAQRAGEYVADDVAPANLLKAASEAYEYYREHIKEEAGYGNR